MPNLRNRFPARRRFLKQSAALTASAATPVLALAASTAVAAGAASSPPPAPSPAGHALDDSSAASADPQIRRVAR